MARTAVIATDEVIDFTVELLCRRLLKSQIRAILAKGNSDPHKGPVFQPVVAHATFGRILSRAREQIRDQLGPTIQTRVGQSLEFYESIIRNPKSKVRDKLKAQERIDKLLGLELRVPPKDENAAAAAAAAKAGDEQAAINPDDLTDDDLRVLSKLKARAALRN